MTAPAPASDATPRFSFGRSTLQETPFGVGWRQLPVAAAGVALAALALQQLPGSVAVPAAVAVVATGITVAMTPVGGYRLDEWAPLAMGWVIQGVTGRRRWRARPPTFTSSSGLRPLDPPPPLVHVDLAAVPCDDGPVGVAIDRRRGVYAAVLRLDAGGGLKDGGGQARQLAQWGGVLATVARGRSALHRLQWLQRSTPDDGRGIAAWFEHRAADDDATESYLRLLEAVQTDHRRHEDLLAVSVAAAKASRAPGGRAMQDAHLIGVLAHEVQLIGDRLTDAGLTVEGVAAPATLAELLRVGFDPFAPRPLGGDDALAAAWPLATDTGARWYRTDGAWHTVYAVDRWPTLPVRGDFLAPLVVSGPKVRTISIVAAPVSAVQATQRVERDLTSSAVNDELRVRAGFRVTARRRQQTDATARREQELADGHQEFEVSALITVSAASRDDLAATCAELEQAAQLAHLGVRPLWGRQAEGFAAALPLALGT